MLIVRNTLKPECAVDIMVPGHCGCQCNSLISDWPWCINNSCGGNLANSLSCDSSVRSTSTDKSHWATTSSAPPEANTVASVGCHSTVVTGAICCLKVATGLAPLAPNCRKSHIQSSPSSPPDIINWLSFGFHEITLISAVWVPDAVNMHAFCGLARVSQIFMLSWETNQPLWNNLQDI